MGGGAGGGEGGCPPHPAAASRNLQEAAGPGEEGRGEGAWLGAGGPGPAGSEGPSGGRAEKEGQRGGEGGEPRVPVATPARCAEGGGAGGGAALPFPPQIAIWRRRAGPERPREAR